MAWGKGLACLCLIAVVQSHSDDLILHAEVEDIGDSFLEMTTSTMGSDDCCHSVGDTHVNAFVDISTQGFDVMGEKEWILTEGPDDETGAVPKWYVQGVQKIWQRCGTHRPEITIMKTLAFQCGSFYMLVDTPWPTHDCHRYASLYHNNQQKIPTNYVIMPRIWMHGTIVDDGTDVSLNGKDDLIQSKYTMKNYNLIFRDGTGSTGEVKWKRNNCNSKTCRYNNMGGDALRFEFYCAGTKVNAKMEGSSYTYFNTYVYVPKNQNDNPPISVGSSRNAHNGNLLGGYCGGWSSAVQSELQAQHNTCRNKSPRPFYIPSGDNTCEQYFTASITNSIFAFFEGWTGGEYDSKFGLDEAQQAANEAGIDQGKMDGCLQTCKDVASQVSSTTYVEAPTNPKEKSLSVNMEECIDDCYFDLVWDTTLMRQELCEVVSYKMQNERSDIFCAVQLLSAECDKVSPSNLLSNLVSLKTASDITTLNAKNADVITLTQEVYKSGLGIEYWYDSACGDYIRPNENFDTLDCSQHEFKETSTDMSRAGFTSTVTHISMGTKHNVNTNGVRIEVDAVIADPVIFFSPPTFADSGSIVPRAYRSGDDFMAFMGTPVCTNGAHSGEILSYMILDKDFTYSADFMVMTTSATQAWSTVTFPATLDGAQISVMTQIQTNNNPNNPYINVRMRSLSATSVEIRLQTDEQSESQGSNLQAETVGLLLIKGDATNHVKGIEYKRGELVSSTSTSVNGAVTTVVQQPAIPDVNDDMPPLVFVSMISSSHISPVNTRTSQTGEHFRFKLDSDQCKDADRSHGQETFHWLAMSLD